MVRPREVREGLTACFGRWWKVHVEAEGGRKERRVMGGLTGRKKYAEGGKPDCVVIHIGTNDIGNGSWVTGEEIAIRGRN